MGVDGATILKATTGVSCITLIVNGVGDNSGLAAILNDPLNFHTLSSELGGKRLKGVDGVHLVSRKY